MLKSKQKFSAFLLCAGKGSRFYPHTRLLPKPLIPFLNLPLLAYNLYLLKTLGVKQISANVHTHPDLLKSQLNEWTKKTHLPSPFLSHEKKLLGSAGGLLKVKSFLEKEKHFFYLNGDSFIFWDEGQSKEINSPSSASTKNQYSSDYKETNYENFYRSHVQSGALASFLVTTAKPVNYKGGYIWARPKGEVYSFTQPLLPEKSNIKPYHWTGLALFSRSIFKEIKSASIKEPPALHIFNDVLSKPALKKHCRVYSSPCINTWDMNQLETYLNNVGKALFFLQAGKKDGPPGPGSFLRKILNFYSPGWDLFEGENYFSATPVNTPPKNPKDILFCGKNVTGLKNLLVKNFAVLGDGASVELELLDSDLKKSAFFRKERGGVEQKNSFRKIKIERAVLGEKVSLKSSLKHSLMLK